MFFIIAYILGSCPSQTLLCTTAFLAQYHMVFGDSHRVPPNANLSSVVNFYLISKRNVSDFDSTMGFLRTVSGDF